MSTSHLNESKRAIGAEWLKNHPRFLERIYLFTKKLVLITYPALQHVSPKLSERVMERGEVLTKGYIFNCQMCGQCILHSTGMTCPMNCPKNLRNGPCGGVRANGHCEVVPDMPCVWVQAWERSKNQIVFANEIREIQPPVNRSLQNTSAWANMVTGVDKQVPKGWQ